MSEDMIGMEDPTGNPPADAEPTVEDKVLDRFGGDPGVLARSYANLEAKFSEQGNEVGDLRKQVSQLIDQAGVTESTNSAPNDPMAAFNERLQSDEEMTVTELADGLMKAMESTFDKRFERLENSIGDMTKAGQFSSIVGNRDNAAAITEQVQQILAEDPDLLPRNLDAAKSQRRMEMLVAMAEDRLGGSTSRTVRRTADSGRTRAPRTTTSGNDGADGLLERYNATGRQEDLTELVGAVLSRKTGRGSGRFG